MKPNAAGFYNVSWAKVTYSSADNGEQVMVVYIVLCSYFEVHKKIKNFVIIGASRSEPHTSQFNRDFFRLYVSVVRRSVNALPLI